MPRRAESRYRYESVQRPDPTRRRGCRRRFVFFHSPSYLSRRAEVSSTLRFPTLLFHTRFFLPPRPLLLAFDPGEDRVAPLTRVYYTRGEVRRGEARRIFRRVFRGGIRGRGGRWRVGFSRMFGGINGVAMNVLELARRILIASVNRETTGEILYTSVSKTWLRARFRFFERGGVERTIFGRTIGYN